MMILVLLSLTSSHLHDLCPYKRRVWYIDLKLRNIPLIVQRTKPEVFRAARAFPPQAFRKLPPSSPWCNPHQYTSFSLTPGLFSSKWWSLSLQAWLTLQSPPLPQNLLKPIGWYSLLHPLDSHKRGFILQYQNEWFIYLCSSWFQ